MTLCVSLRGLFRSFSLFFFFLVREGSFIFILLSDLFFFWDMSVLKDIETVLIDYVKEYQGIYKVNKEVL